MSTKIVLKTCYSESQIEVPSDDLDAQGVVDSLFAPIMLAIGFHPDTVKKYLPDWCFNDLEDTKIGTLPIDSPHTCTCNGVAEHCSCCPPEAETV